MGVAVNYDIVIAGAGPAGTACALALKNRNFKVALIEAQTFPRDKICGDAIPNRAVSVIRQIAPELYSQLKNLPVMMPSEGCRIVAPSGKETEIRFQLEGYVSRRLDFDNLLLQHTLSSSQTDFFPAEKVIAANSSSGQAEIVTDKRTFITKLIIGCDGAHSEIRKNLLDKTIDTKHYCGAVRAYFKGIEKMKAGMMEIYLLKELPYAYFWIFPLPEGRANVGLGMLSEKISQMKINLREKIQEIINRHEVISLRFKKAEQEGPVKGFGLPLGSLQGRLSGLRFMLCGDAGSLIDPATGEGIGNAMLSGMIAANRAVSCFEKNDFSVSFLSGYDREVYGRLAKEFRSKYRLQQLIGSKPFIADWAIGAAQKFPWIKNRMQKLF